MTGSSSLSRPEHYDVVVIGSGIAGITAASRLAQGGRRVLILEQHFQLGGLATWFRRPGKELFDISLHGFPVGMKKTVRKYWSRDLAQAIIRLKRIRFSNPQFELETTFDQPDFRRHLIETFGVDVATVDAFFDRLSNTEFYDESDETVGDLFEQYFPDRNDIVRFLMETITYANGSTLTDPAKTYGIVFNNFAQDGIWTFGHDTNWIVKHLRQALRDRGVEVKRNTLVTQILLDDDRRVRGVATQAGEVFSADVVLSNANVVTTVEELLPSGAVPDDFFHRAQSVRMNNASCQVYLGIKEDTSIPDLGDIFFTSSCPTFDPVALSSKDVSSWTFSFYYPWHRPEHGRYSIVASLNANWDDWVHLDDQQYQQDKTELVEKTLDWLERWIPDIRRKISHQEAATPRTFYHYARVRRGTSFGTKFEGLEVSQRLPQVIPGLYHAGSVGIIMSGWLGTANYGVIVASKIDQFLIERDEALAKGVGEST